MLSRLSKLNSTIAVQAITACGPTNYSVCAHLREHNRRKVTLVVGSGSKGAGGGGGGGGGGLGDHGAHIQVIRCELQVDPAMSLLSRKHHDTHWQDTYPYVYPSSAMLQWPSASISDLERKLFGCHASVMLKACDRFSMASFVQQ